MRTVNKYDSFEDWPWPLIFREIEKNFSDCKFILTKRRNPDLWFNSLCRHAIYGGPLTRFEKYIYGYPIPHGHKAEHIKIYNEHNKSVEDYFKNKSGKLLTVCWENGDGWEEISAFLGNEAPDIPFPHYNRSGTLPYTGDNRIIAKTYMLTYKPIKIMQRILKRFTSASSSR
jgi:hypothetical protein